MESKRNYQLDVLKFFFTLCIFLYHARLLAPAGGLARQISDKWGWFGVHFFFIVSGMLMANSFMRHRTEQTQEPGKAAVRFVVHKFRSIAGIYFISFSFNFVIRFCIELHAHQDVSALTTLWKLILGSVPELFLVQMSGVRQIGVNSVTWYISAMLLVMLPLYYFLCKKTGLFPACIQPYGSADAVRLFHPDGQWLLRSERLYRPLQRRRASCPLRHLRRGCHLGIGTVDPGASL